MSSGATVRRVVHKSVKSLDFVSNEAKSANAGIEPVSKDPLLRELVSTIPKNTLIKQLKHTRRVRHPFYRPSQIQKLQTVSDISKTPINSLFATVKLTNGVEIIRDTLKFDSATEAFDFFNKIEGIIELKQVDDFKPDYLSVEIKDQSKLDELISKEFDEFLNTRINNGDKVLTNQDKMLYFISKHLNESESSENILKYLNTSTNYNYSKQIVQNYLFKLHSLDSKDHDSVKAVTDAFLNKYSNGSTDVDVLNAMILNYSDVSKINKVKHLILQLQDLGYSPYASSVESLIINLRTKYNNNRTEVLKELRGFEDVIHTAFNVDIAQALIPLCKNYQELKAILDTLETQQDKANLKEQYKQLENELITQIVSLPTQKVHTKIELVSRVMKHIELSDRSKLNVIEFSLAKGSFILAASLLKQMDTVSPTDLKLLTEVAKARDVFGVVSGCPGHDEVSRESFLTLVGGK